MFFSYISEERVCTAVCDIASAVQIILEKCAKACMFKNYKIKLTHIKSDYFCQELRETINFGRFLAWNNSKLAPFQTCVIFIRIVALIYKAL